MRDSDLAEEINHNLKLRFLTVALYFLLSARNWVQLTGKIAVTHMKTIIEQKNHAVENFQFPSIFCLEENTNN